MKASIEIDTHIVCPDLIEWDDRLCVAACEPIDIASLFHYGVKHSYTVFEVVLVLL